MLEEVEGDDHVAAGHVLEAASLHQPHGGVDDRFGGEAVNGSVLKAENVTGKMEGADLAAAVRQQFMTANRTFHDLVDVVGGLRLAVNSVPFLYLNSLKIALARESSPSSPRTLDRLLGWALTLTNMDLSCLSQSFSHP